MAIDSASAPDAALFPPHSLAARLRAAAGDHWLAYVNHAFVSALADGSLSPAAFRYYLVQDYLFLIHFARAYALAAYKSQDLDDMRQAVGQVVAIVDREMSLHVAYCADWGLNEAEMAAQPEDPACLAYTRYVLERGMAGDLLDLHVALAPCVIGYAEIGLALAGSGPATSPYRAWIDAYAGEDYQGVARAAVAQLDRLYAGRGGEARFVALAHTFTTATRLETDFWQMGLDATDKRTDTA